MSKHAQIFDYWLAYHATDKERRMTYDEQCHAIQIWLQTEENWRMVMKEFDEYDAYGNPPSRTPPRR